MKRRLMVTLGVFAAVSLVLAYAQTINFQVDFSFSAAGKAFPPGKYTLEIQEPESIVLSGPGGRVIMPVVTRLALLYNASKAQVAFDKVADKYFLSEVWYPGKDGYLILTSAPGHEHAIVDGMQQSQR